ncbi:MAG: hypothetical protein IKT98_00240 [Selenomonadaceae bacterium]|nr:hypothetical protein [Selenomonadaceae bacterium]
MRKKKVLVHGTAESMNNFFSDAVSHDFEVVALISEENLSSEMEVLSPQNLPKAIYKLADGIILTNAVAEKSVVKFFLKQGVEPRKIILWDVQQGWGVLNFPDKDGKQVIHCCGLDFHIRNEDDMKFFNEIHVFLQQQRRLKNLNPKLYPEALAKYFQKSTGQKLDFNNLKTFTQKMQWIKIYDATPLKSRLADKYLVRNWVAEKIGAEYLIPLLGVWNDFDDINFDELPDQFVLKCNHGSGMNIIVRDKKTFDKQNAHEKINAWLTFNFSALALELHYTRVDRKIIAEKFMTNGNLPDLTDYKFWCFNGKPTYCVFYSNRSTDCRMNYFDMNWECMHFRSIDHPNSEHPEKIPKPKNFELMKELAIKLAEGFSFVRVDFYEIEGRVYFGEMTFTPAAGNLYFNPTSTDEYLGSLLKLPEPTPPPQL